MIRPAQVSVKWGMTPLGIIILWGQELTIGMNSICANVFPLPAAYTYHQQINEHKGTSSKEFIQCSLVLPLLPLWASSK